MQPATTPDALDHTFQALRRVMAAIRGRFHRGLQSHGLTFPQWLLIKNLRRQGRMTIKQLADALEVTPANVTGIVDRLERDGLATRTRDPTDRRVVHVRLTEQGHEKAHEIVGLGTAILGDLFAGWTTHDLEAFRDLLERVKLAPDDAADF